MSGPRLLLAGAALLVASVVATALSVFATANILLTLSEPGSAAALLGALLGILPEAMIVTGACGIAGAAALLVRTNLLARPGRGTGRR